MTPLVPLPISSRRGRRINHLAFQGHNESQEVSPSIRAVYRSDDPNRRGGCGGCKSKRQPSRVARVAGTSLATKSILFRLATSNYFTGALSVHIACSHSFFFFFFFFFRIIDVYSNVIFHRV